MKSFHQLITATATLLSSILAETTISQSHIYHSAPQAIISAILSHVSSSPPRNDGSINVLNIDVSSSRLDDESMSLLVDKLLIQLDENIQDECDERIKIKMDLSMNKLTPSGVAKLFNRLVARVDNHETGGTEDFNKTTNVLNLNSTEDDDEFNLTRTESAETENETTTSSQRLRLQQENEQPVELEELDLSFNDIGGHGSNPANLEFLNSVRRLFEHGQNLMMVPKVLKLENCGVGPAFCRSVGRGILNAFETEKRSKYRPCALHLGGNEAIGDPGAVSLAAALRLAIPNSEKNEDGTQQYVLKELVLSSCNIQDAGAESLALALAFNPNCISKLDLSSNAISDVGATAIGRALVEAHRTKVMNGDKPLVLDEIVLDNNVKVGNDGAEALAEAMKCGALRSVSLRSCSVKAEGAAAFGKAIVSLAKLKDEVNGLTRIEIDLSGNTLGIKPVKKKKGLKDKASSHITSFGKTLQKSWRGGLKGAGVSMGFTAESDDDEENFGVMGGLIDADEVEDSDKIFEAAERCGARSFAAEILNSSDALRQGGSMLNIGMAFRRCNLDDGAIDALSAAIVKSKKPGTNIVIDVSLNSFEPEIVSALLGCENHERLDSMAQRHMTALSVLNEARERATIAAETAMARAEAENELEGFRFGDVDSDYDQYDDEC